MVAGAVGGGLLAVWIGQKFTAWALESQTNTLIIVAGGIVAGAALTWQLTARSVGKPDAAA